MTEFTRADHYYMQLAITLAKKGWYTTSPNPRVGCVLVKNDQIIGQGYHLKAGEGHAEVNALAQAGSDANGCIAYVTLEPCSHFGRTPPCAQALINAGVSKVIAAMVDPNPSVSGRGLKMLEKAGISTAFGLLEQEARALNTGFIQLMTHQIPYVRCKLASSLDGKIAMASGESQWITSPQARQDVQRIRAQSCAIISGADSVITDNAKMTVRWSELGDVRHEYAIESIRQPIRVIIDTKNRVTPNLALFESPSPILLIRRTLDNQHQWPHFVEQVVVKMAPASDSGQSCSEHVCLLSLLKLLAQRGCNDILVESGGTLAGAFIEQALVDELILYQAPKLIGAKGISLVNLPDTNTLAETKKLSFQEITMVGPDIKIVAQINTNEE